MPIANTDLLDSLTWRYATKQFDIERKIPTETWEALEQVLVLTPSSYGLQPWTFLVIDDPALRKELRPFSWNQAQITEASHLVVFLTRRQIEDSDLDRLLALDGTPYRSCVVCAAGYRSANDKYASLEKVRYPLEELIEHR